MRLVNAPDRTPTRYSEAGYFATISSMVVAFLYGRSHTPSLFQGRPIERGFVHPLAAQPVDLAPMNGKILNLAWKIMSFCCASAVGEAGRNAV